MMMRGGLLSEHSTVNIEIPWNRPTSILQHLGKSPRTNRPVTVPAHSTPRNDCHENDHPLPLNDFKIIDSANNEHELRILESLYICKEKPSLNIDQSATPLSLF